MQYNFRQMGVRGIVMNMFLSFKNMTDFLSLSLRSRSLLHTNNILLFSYPIQTRWVS